MRQRYNDNRKKPKTKQNQLGILKFYVFCQKIQQRALGPGESAACWGCVSMRMHPKNCCIFTLKVATTLTQLVVQGRVQLEHSSQIVKVGVEATC